MTAQPTQKEALDWNWGVPDWRDEEAYFATHDLTDRQWRWEFMRRRPLYREDWVRWFWQQREFVEKNEARFRRELGLDWSKDKALETVMPDDFRERCLTGTSGWIKDPSRQFSDWDLQQFGVGRGEPKAPPRGPKRARTPLSWGRDDFAARERRYYESGVWCFDLTQPLPPQFAIAKAYLAKIQVKLYGKQNTPKPRRAHWPLYLRALDAKDAGAGYDLMARTFWPNDLDKKTPQSARDVYEGAVALRNNFPF